jgi:protein-L-isoaspartate(D-aspartate) O-methyltransferase
MPKTKEGLVRLVERSGVSERVVDAFRAVDRRDFVPEGLGRGSYGDRPIPLPEQQTTSQPSLIAAMIDAARITPDDHVLEVGTGYGFQTALLAHLAKDVVSLERFATLAEAARSNLERAGVENAVVMVGDGWQGAPESAPFDAIVVSAAATEVPAPLGEQLREGGRLVIPLRRDHGDAVYLFERRSGEVVRVRLLTPASFVPLVPGSPC